MSLIPRREPNVDSNTAQKLRASFMESRQEILAHMQSCAHRAVTLLEAQPSHYNVGEAMDFRVIEFDNGATVACHLRGWKIRQDLYIIPGLDGFLSPRTASRYHGVCSYRPFEDFLPRSNDSFDYVDLINEIHDLIVSADQAARTDQKRGDGMDND